MTRLPEPRSPVAGQPIRGSDSQLCPKPPPKPSKVLLSRLPPPSDSPGLHAPQPDSSCVGTPAFPRRPGGKVNKHVFESVSGRSDASLVSSAPPGSPSEPLKFLHQLQPAERSLGSSHSGGPPADPLRVSEALAGFYESSGAFDLQPPLCGHVERLRREEVGGGEAAGRSGLDRSSYHHAIASFEYTSEEEEDDRKRKRAGETGGFLRPIVETESAFRPADFGSRLLPAENKPLEMLVLKRAKELLLSHDHQSIARHLLKADCQVNVHAHTRGSRAPRRNHPSDTNNHLRLLLQVARIIAVTPQLKSQMGVSSGLELVTLPHGRQLRLDLMERYACTHARLHAHARLPARIATTPDRPPACTCTPRQSVGVSTRAPWPCYSRCARPRHHTMAIGVAVDILGCTGSVDERATTLNRIILVALELKDTVGDLFAFTALMKALDLPQVRHTHTDTHVNEKEKV